MSPLFEFGPSSGLPSSANRMVNSPRSVHLKGGSNGAGKVCGGGELSSGGEGGGELSSGDEGGVVMFSEDKGEGGARLG